MVDQVNVNKNVVVKYVSRIIKEAVVHGGYRRCLFYKRRGPHE